MVTYFKSQKDLAEALIKSIDAYWNYELAEEDLLSQVNEYILKNKEKMYGTNDYTSVIKQRLGKKRIELLNKLLKQTEE
jgi:uncharacterized protein (TIGR04540 family)